MHSLFAEARGGGAATRRRCLAVLARTLDAAPSPAPFLDCVDLALPTPRDSAALEGILEFIAAAVFLRNNTLLLPCLEHLMRARFDCKDRSVRARSVGLVARILVKAPPASVPSAVLNELAPLALARANDKLPAVRLAALHCLARLQETDAAAADAVSWALAHDSSRDVRAAAARIVLLGDVTLPLLVSRAISDVSAEVRAGALTRLRTSAAWQTLSLTDRRSVTVAGCADPSPSVRDAAAALLAGALWSCEGNVPAFLESFDCVEPWESAARGRMQQQVEGGDLSTAHSTSGGAPPPAALAVEAAARAALSALFAFAERARPASDAADEAPAGASAPSDAAASEGCEGIVEGCEGGDDDAPAAPVQPGIRGLWDALVTSLSAMQVPADEFTPEGALFLYARAAWLSGSDEGGAGPHPATINTSTIPLAAREAALDALLPDAATLYNVIAVVANALGAIPPSNECVAAATFTLTRHEGGEAGQEVAEAQVLRTHALRAGVSAPSTLGSVCSLPATPDAVALSTLHFLLSLAPRLDYSDTCAREQAQLKLLSLLSHPATPEWAVSSIVTALAVAFGCSNSGSTGAAQAGMSSPPQSSASVEGYYFLASTLLAVIGSLREAVDIAIARGTNGVDDGMASGVGKNDSAAALAEALRQALEEAQDVADAAPEGSAAAAAADARVSALEGQLRTAEAAVASAAKGVGAASAALAPSRAMLLEEGHVHLPPQELAGLLWARALSITCVLLRGPHGLTGGSLLPRGILSDLLCRCTPSFFRAPLPGTPLPSSHAIAGVELLCTLIAPSVMHALPAITASGCEAATLFALAQPNASTAVAALSSLGVGAALWAAAGAGGGEEGQLLVRSGALKALGDLSVALTPQELSEACSLPASDNADSSCEQLFVSALTTPSLWRVGGGATAASGAAFACVSSAADALMRMLFAGAVPPCAATMRQSVLGGAPAAGARGPLDALWSVYSALLWRNAATGDGGASDAGDLKSAVALTASLGAFFPTYAAVSHEHRAAALAACVGGMHAAMAAGIAAGVATATGAPSAAALAGGAVAPCMFGAGTVPSVSTAAPISPVLDAGVAEEEEEAAPMDKENAEEDDDGAFVRRRGIAARPAPKKPVAVRKSRAVVASVEVGAVAAAGAAASTLPAGGWLIACLQTAIALAGVQPLSPAPSSRALPSWLSTTAAAAISTPEGAVPVEGVAVIPAPLSAVHVCLSLLADLTADARSGASGAAFSPALAHALAQLLPSAAASATEEDTALIASVLDTASAAVDGRGAALEKALAQLTACVGVPPDAASPAAVAGFAALVAERTVALADAGSGAGGAGGVAGGRGRGRPPRAAKGRAAPIIEAALSDEEGEGPTAAAVLAPAAAPRRRLSAGVGPARRR